METLGRLIENLLYRKDLWKGYCRRFVVDHWGILVGDNIGQVSQAREVNGGLLLVTVRDSTWAHHLSLLKPQILQKINARFESAVIRDIYFQVGDLPKKEIAAGKGEYITFSYDPGAGAGDEDFRRNIRALRDRCKGEPGD